ncbi:MAG: hypothetical protein F4203_08975, partial [Rhodobacteraceae bacterium]|nr:hypothetical protein [Paracoccaceae bacterium]
MKPSFRGADLIGKLRKNGFKYPILMLTGQITAPKGNQESDIVGDPLTDYVSKTAGYELLGARLLSQLNSYETSLEDRLKICNSNYSPGKRIL